MMFRPRRDDEDPEVPMTPIIDCVFLLLVFFLVTASLKRPHMELPITLPSAEASVKAKAAGDELIFSIDRAGEIYVDTVGVRDMPTGSNMTFRHDSAVSNQRLHTLLRDVARVAPTARVRIDCDTHAMMHQVAKIVDLCQLYDLRDVGIRTKDR